MRLIDADALMDELNWLIEQAAWHNRDLYEDFAMRIKNAPTIEADRPQGEWKSVKASIYPYGCDVECSICGHRMGSSFGYKYCPMCGADMRGADDE